MAQQVGMLYAMSHREDKSCCNFFHDHVHIFMPIIRHGCQKKVLLSKSPFQSVTKRQGPDNDVKVGRGHLSIWPTSLLENGNSMVWKIQCAMWYSPRDYLPTLCQAQRRDKTRKRLGQWTQMDTEKDFDHFWPLFSIVASTEATKDKWSSLPIENKVPYLIRTSTSFEDLVVFSFLPSLAMVVSYPLLFCQ